MTEPLDDARGELLACPICKVRKAEVYQRDQLWIASCENDDCRFTVEVYGHTEADATATWNTRAAPVPQCDAVTTGPTAEDIRACAWSTLIGFQHELGDRNIEFICDQISRKAALTHSSTHHSTPGE